MLDREEQSAATRSRSGHCDLQLALADFIRLDVQGPKRAPRRAEAREENRPNFMIELRGREAG
jgi:hypothetical protein